MPLTLQSFTASSQDIGNIEKTIGTLDLQRDLRFALAVYISNIATNAGDIVLRVNVVNRTGSPATDWGEESFTLPKNPGAAASRVQFDKLIFVPATAKANLYIKSTASNDVSVNWTAYAFDGDFSSEVNSMATQAKADVKTEVLGALQTDNIVDDRSVIQVLEIAISMLACKCSGAGTGTETFRNLDDDTNRVVVTVDANGNRTGVAYG